jgi:pSer/pThr/pTyr-binding forkhead associated (FHA) protein
MRISFPNGEHADVTLAGGSLSIGAAAGNDVVLPSEGVQPRHASLSIDPQRGILLHVAGGGATVHVNGRAIQEFGILRLGDVLSIGRAQLLLKPDRDDAIVVKVPAGSAPALSDPAVLAATSRVVLRGVAGGFYGRSIALQEKVVVGRGAAATVRIDDPELPEQAVSFEVFGDRVVLRDLGTPDGAVVNGVPVRDAILHPGDQIAIEVHRFVLEAPGLPLRGSEAAAEPLAPGAHAGSTQTMRAVRVEPPTPQPAVQQVLEPAAASTGRNRLGWLLLAGALIAAALAGLFLYGPT